MADLPNDFTFWDYLVFLSTLVVSMGIGVYFAFKGDGQKTQGEYLMGGRKMQLLPVTISILASLLSAILFLGTPAEMYQQGAEFLVGTLGIMFGFLASGVFIVPLFYPLGITSSYEYLELRFHSRATRLLGTYMMLIGQIIFVALVSYAPAIALEAVTHFPVWATLLVAGLVATFYTTIGGLKAVVWTDVFQGCLMLVGVISIIIQGTLKVGGFSRVWEINAEWERLNVIVVDLDPRTRHTIFGLTFGQGMAWLGASITQSSIQRYCSLPTLRQAQAAMLLNVLIVGVLVSLVCYSGITMFAYYAQQNCDLLSQGLVDNTNQLIPYFVMDILAFPPIPGLFMASLFSGSLSSMSSSLNSMAAILWEDTLKPHLDHKLSETRKTLFIKILVAILGAVCIAASYATIFLDGTLVQAANSLLTPSWGSLAGMFLLGALFPWANKYGAIAGGIAGLSVSGWQALAYYFSGITNFYLDLPTPNGTCGVNTTTAPIEVGTTMLDLTSTPIYSTMQPDTDSDSDGNAALTFFYSISYVYVSAIATFTCLIVGLLVSFLTNPLIPKEERTVPTKYMIPVLTRILCCVPDSWHYYLECGREFERKEDIFTSKKESSDTTHKELVYIRNVRSDYVGEPGEKTKSYEMSVKA